MVNLLAATRSTARVAATSGVVTANRACLRVSPASAVASVPGWGEAFVDGEEVVVGLGLGLGLTLTLALTTTPALTLSLVLTLTRWSCRSARCSTTSRVKSSSSAQTERRRAHSRSPAG